LRIAFATLASVLLVSCSPPEPEPTPEPVSESTDNSFIESVKDFTSKIEARAKITRNNDTPSTDDFYMPVKQTREYNDTEVLALTFDDGPSMYTDSILDILDEYDAKATFCVVGSQVELYPEKVQRIIEEGHALCNHSYSHNLSMSNWTKEDIVDDLSRTDELIEDIVGEEHLPIYYRAPGGFFSESTGLALEEIGMRPLDWGIDPQDWTTPGTQNIIDTVIEGESSDVVLLHDGGGDRSQTVEALPQILKYYDSKDFNFVKVVPD